MCHTKAEKNGGKYVNLNRDVDIGAEFSCNLYIA